MTKKIEKEEVEIAEEKAESKRDDSVKHSKQTRRYHGYEERLVKKVILSLILVILAVVTLEFGFYKKSDVSVKYTETSNLDYYVYLLENDFYPNDYLGKDQQYVASLIDYIDVHFNYYYNLSEEADIKYTYRIVAETLIYEKGNKNNIIFRNNEDLLAAKELQVTNRNFNITEKIQLDYASYNDLVRTFKTEYNLLVESELTLKLYIESNADIEKLDEDVIATNTMTLNMPLTEQTININMDYKAINNSQEYVGKTTHNMFNYGCLVVGGILAVIAFIQVILTVSFTMKRKKKKTSYEKLVSRILRDYDRLIITSRKVHDFNNDMPIIDVDLIEELVDASERIEKPIIFMEIQKNQKCWFIVQDQNQIYRYIVKAVDLD